MKKVRYILIFIITILILIISIIVGFLTSRNDFIGTKNIEKQKLTQTTDENSYVTMKNHLEEVNDSYRKGYEKGKSTSNETIIVYFGGKEILANETKYGNSGGNYMASITLGGSGLLIENIDPKIFSEVRYQGEYWAGSASGNYPNSGISSGSLRVYFVDKVTGETVLETNSHYGRPFEKITDISNLPNPVDMYWNGRLITTSYGDATGACFIKNIYLKVRDDYQG